MNTYKQAGVNVEAGDKASRIAYENAKKTFTCRDGLFGTPVTLDGGYAGLIDMKDFYLVQNDDGIGTKSMVAEQVNKYDTLGYDLLCMVADDAVCLGAEVISITNTIDTNKVKPELIEPMMQGLSKACIEQKILIPGGEIGELPDLANGITWNAAAVGIVAKDKVIDGSKISEGDTLIALPSYNFRSNGLTLARFVLKNKFGDDWYSVKFNQTKTWGEVVLEPSKIYHNDLLKLLGRYGQERKFEINGIAHITGGGIEGNLPRILKKTKLGAEVKLPEALIPESMKQLMDIGNIKVEEALKTWNMGIAMILVTDKPQELQSELSALSLESHIVGKITAQPDCAVEIV
jgi:phosphoribosylformylglycinamidine cyclo-ligase